MYSKKYTPEEALEIIKVRMNYDLTKTLKENEEKPKGRIGEQTGPGITSFPSSAPTGPAAAKSKEQEIADKFYDAAAGVGTDTKKMLDAVSQITSAKQFYDINAYLKTKNKKLDFEQTINDELNVNNFSDVTKIIDHLKTLGIESTAKKAGGDNMVMNSFKITSSPVAPTTAPTAAPTGTPTAAPTGTPTAAPTGTPTTAPTGSTNAPKGVPGGSIPKELTDVKAFQDWLDKNHPGWHDKYKTLNSDVAKGYGKYGPRTTKAWAQYKDEYLKKPEVTPPTPVDAEEGGTEEVYGDDPKNILANN